MAPVVNPLVFSVISSLLAVGVQELNCFFCEVWMVFEVFYVFSVIFVFFLFMYTEVIFVFFYQNMLCLSQVLFTYLLSKYLQDWLRSCQMFVKKGSGFKGKAKVTLVVVAGNEKLVSTYLKTADFK